MFGSDPLILGCLSYCFFGDNRTLSTSHDATARITGILKFWMPGALLGSKRAFSDPSVDKFGDTATGHPTITTAPGANGYLLHMEFAGSNPLVPYPLSPDIDTKLDFTPVLSSGQICYSGHLYGDAFPDAEVFEVNSRGLATMLLEFTTTYGPNQGPFSLIGNNNRDMGSFSSQCAAR